MCASSNKSKLYLFYSFKLLSEREREKKTKTNFIIVNKKLFLFLKNVKSAEIKM